MAYSRPTLLTDGDIVDQTDMRTLRDNWIAYEIHAHTGNLDGAQISPFSPAGIMSIVR